MKFTKTFISASIVSLSLLTGIAHAEISSAQVDKELAESKYKGTYTFGEEGYPAAASFPNNTSLSRDQVNQEYEQAKQVGLVTHGELDYPPETK